MKPLIIVLLILYPSILFSQGTVEFISFFSNSLQQPRSLYVYLPEGYDPQGLTDYPVVYFLHGGGFASYPFLHGMLDNLIGSGTISPIIFVQPDGSGANGAGYYTNSDLNGNYEDYGAYTTHIP